MLSSRSRTRIFQHIPGNRYVDDPAPLEIEYVHSDGRIETVDLTGEVEVWWTRQDQGAISGGVTYPAIVLELSPTGVVREYGQTVSEVLRRITKPEDPTVAYEEVRGEKVYDILHITVATNQRNGTIPKTDVAREIAREVYAQFKFNSGHLNERGVDADGRPLPEGLASSPPLRITQRPGTGIQNTSAMVDEQSVSRYEMQWRVEYELSQRVLVDAVEAIEWEFTVDGVGGAVGQRVTTAHSTTARWESPEPSVE